MNRYSERFRGLIDEAFTPGIRDSLMQSAELAKASGVKAIKLKDDNLIAINNFDPTKDEFISIITDKGTGKRIRLNEFEISSRTR